MGGGHMCVCGRAVHPAPDAAGEDEQVPRLPAEAGRRRAAPLVRRHDHVLVRRMTPFARALLPHQLRGRRLKGAGEPFERRHPAGTAEQPPVRDEDRGPARDRARAVHPAEALVARREEDVVGAAMPLPEEGHGAAQVERRQLDVGAGAPHVTRHGIVREERHQEEVGLVRVGRAHRRVPEEAAQEAPLGRVDTVAARSEGAAARGEPHAVVSDRFIHTVHDGPRAAVVLVGEQRDATVHGGGERRVSQLERHLVHVDAQRGVATDGRRRSGTRPGMWTRRPTRRLMARRRTMSAVDAVGSAAAHAQAEPAAAAAGAAPRVAVVMPAAPAAPPRVKVPHERPISGYEMAEHAAGSRELLAVAVAIQCEHPAEHSAPLFIEGALGLHKIPHKSVRRLSWVRLPTVLRDYCSRDKR